LKELSVGIVGCGWSSEKHLNVYAQTKGVKLVAVCDLNLTKAEEKAQKYAIPHAFKKFDSMLKLDLDLIDIITPCKTHSELAIRALESRHNVLVEKPMALSSRECLLMIAAAKKSGKTLCVVHNKRFFDSIVKIKTCLNRENLEVSRMRIAQFFHPPKKINGTKSENPLSIFWDSFVHHIYLSQFFFGRIDSVYASVKKVNYSIYDSLTLLLHSGSKISVNEFQWGVKEPITQFQLITKQGDRFDGDLEHDFFVRRSRSYKNLRTTAYRSLFDDLSLPFVKWANILHNLIEMRSLKDALPFEKTYFILIRQFLSYLQGVQSSPPVNAEEGLRAIRVLEAAEKSIETGKEQSLL
jgi:predicted dehydrogenase